MKPTKQSLPEEFLSRLEAQFDQATYKKLLNGFKANRYTSARVNTIKTDIATVTRKLREKNIHAEQLPYLKNALVFKNHNEKLFEEMDMFKNGEIYLQSLSSQLPAIVLNPQSGEKVLDMTAAPGSKTTQIASMMGNNGEIVANELDNIRFERLKFNIQRQGVTNTITRLGNAITLGNEFPDMFDRVLLDAPCGGEGKMHTEYPSTYRFWSVKFIHQHSRLQKQLFLSAYRALKPGGAMVYSTCTLAPEENEKIVEWALTRFPDLKLKKIQLPIPGALPVLRKFLDLTFSEELQKCLKVGPNEYFEGFFVANFEKGKI